MRRWFKRLGLLLLTLVLVTGVLLVHTLWGKPLFINWFFERMFLEYALDDPEMLSRIRLFEPLGLRFHNDDLTDASPAREDALRAKLNADYALLRRYDRAKLNAAERLSYDILAYFLALQVRGERFRYHNFPVNQLFGVQSLLPSFLADVHQVRNPADAQDYLTRLSKVGVKFDQVLAGLRLRESRQILPPRFMVEKVIAQMRRFRAAPAADNVLFVSFRAKLQAAGNRFTADERARLEAAVLRRIENVVYPAYDALIAHFEGLLGQVRSNDGVWRLPEGAEFYAYAVEMHTTSRMSPDQLHQLGLAEVARIHGEMDAVLRASGRVDGSVGARLSALAQDPTQLYASDPAGHAQILHDFQAILTEASTRLDRYFDVHPSAGIEVRRVPEFSEKTAAGAYYQMPAMDGSRPGVFYVNLRNVRELPRFGMRTLAYHEGIPGHHFQLGIAQELRDLPTFRRLLPFTAYSEGWALYAERLAFEAGLQGDPLDNLGRLQAELLRAVRLVVDTGLHAQRWSRERAIDYMVEMTGLSQSDVEAEIERYLVNPGQALAYTVGMLKILQLRDRAQRALGARFDIRAFHNCILTSGAMPLAVLEQRVDAWIVAQTRN